MRTRSPWRVLRAIPAGLALLLVPLWAMGQAAGPPTVAQIVFTPASIASGGTSQLTIVLSNPNATAATLTQALVNTFPPGLTAAGAGGGSCTAGAIIARAGANTVSYAAGAAIPSGGCTISVPVKATSAAGATYFTDTIPAGALQTDFGASPSGASAQLTVQAAVNVPNLVGLSQAAAAAALQGAGLVLGTVTKAPSTSPYNTVASQFPGAAAQAAAGSAVNIVISQGPNPSANPNAPISTSAAVTPAQVSVAAAVERTCANLSGTPAASLTDLQKSLLANCRAIINTYGGGNNSANLANTLNAVSGKQTTAQQTTGVKFANTQFTNIGARLAQLRSGATGASAAGLDWGLPAGAAPLQTLLAAIEEATAGDGRETGGSSGDSDKPSLFSRFGFFVNGRLTRGSEATTDYETGFDFRDNGVTGGVDYRFNDHFVLGLAGGYATGDTNFVDASAHLNSRSTTGSLYASYYLNDLYIDVIGTYGHIKYQSRRTTDFALDPTLTVTAPNCSGSVCSIDVDGSTGARQYAVGSSAGYDFHRSGFVFGPDLALNYVRINVEGFTENDPTASGMALSYDGQTGESLVLKAGGHLSYVISTPLAVISPQIRARYDHEFKNDQRASTAHFAADPTINGSGGPISNFTVFTNTPDRSYFDWAAGVSAQFPFGISAFVDYNSIAQEQYLKLHELTFGIRFQYVVR